ncbi:hypothetical protein F5Y19DRAFT_477939 [Xylariaceae sp. FL1651]|nr:hypothetical protein F5Y19DRAFT_477939 [Xylariaceae sp. FL1651]
MSSSSDMSPLSSPDLWSDNLVFSARPSPGLIADNMQSPKSPQRYLRTSGTRSPPRSINADESSFPVPGSASSTQSLTPVRSLPIAIELPTTKAVSSAPVHTLPAPLSARGDLPGGYFPLHEEQSRVYRPHPFQLDATKARMKSIERASKATPSDLEASSVNAAREGTGPATTNVPPAKVDRAVQIPQLDMTNLSRSESTSTANTPVASYMPLGAQDSPLPMGKYYPSNYEKRKDEKRKGKIHRPATANSTILSSTKSESQVPTINQNSAANHSRNESEAKRRLQQYQRDMIAQATLALHGGNVNQATLSSLRSLGFSNMAKPSKPRLAPLGSPGPVTPMELEGSDDGYLGARGVADAQAEEIARAIRAEGEQKRREGATSPVVDLGPTTL